MNFLLESEAYSKQSFSRSWYGIVLQHSADIWKALTILNGRVSAYSGFVHVISL